MIYTVIGKAVFKFVLSTLRRRYSTQIRIGTGLVVAAAGIAVYLANRGAPEG